MNDEDEEWVLRPIRRGMCQYESLVNGALGLHDLARMNEALDVEDENESRARAALEARRNR